MRGDNSINTSSLAGRERARKVSEVRKTKNGQIFETIMIGLPLFLCNAVPSTPIKRGSNGGAYEMRKKMQKKKGGEEREKGGNNAGSNRKKKKKKKKKISMRIHFPTVTPAP